MLMTCYAMCASAPNLYTHQMKSVYVNVGTISIYSVYQGLCLIVQYSSSDLAWLRYPSRDDVEDVNCAECWTALPHRITFTEQPTPRREKLNCSV